MKYESRKTRLEVDIEEPVRFNQLMARSERANFVSVTLCD